MKYYEEIPGLPTVPDELTEDARTKLKDVIMVEKTKEGRRVYCTECGEMYYLDSVPRLSRPEDRALLAAVHKSKCECARCGAQSEVINLGIRRKLSNITDYQYFLFYVPVSEDEVWALAEEWSRRFFDGAVDDSRYLTGAYHFVKGEGCTRWKHEWYNGFRIVKRIDEPFGYSENYYGYAYNDYFVGGDECLTKTFFKYLPDTLHTMREMSVFARYPTITEMLIKSGHDDIVIRRSRGYATNGVCNFGAKTPKRFWKLNKLELKEWTARGADYDEAVTYLKKFRGERDGFDLARGYNLLLGGCYPNMKKEIENRIKEGGFTEKEVIKYLGRQNEGTTMLKDYLDAAAEVGYDLTVHNVFFPKNLREAHDAATAAVKFRRNEMAEAEYKKRKQERAEKYQLAGGGYLIRLPESADEIIAEGKALCHCVGGYAERHCKGETTILFMRSASDPETPLYTIEVRDGKVAQCHGLKNVEHPRDNEAAKAFYDAWKTWIENGSKKREKPYQDKKKKAEVA